MNCDGVLCADNRSRQYLAIIVVHCRFVAGTLLKENIVKIKNLLLIVMLLTVSSESLAASHMGGTDCATWVNATGPEKASYDAWLIGFLSGINASYEVFGPDRQDPLDGVTSRQAFEWMKNYCQANPKKHITFAAMTLFFKLKK